jgi:hypothetical protein
MSEEQTPLWQSLPTVQGSPFGQGAQEPPQSTAVSSPSFSASAQEGATQVPVFLAGSQTWGEEQSAFVLQATHFPASDPVGSPQTLPLSVLHCPMLGVWIAWPPLQASVVQALLSLGTSVSSETV